MSSAEVDAPGGARTIDHEEPVIESNGCSSEAEQRSSNGHVTTIDDITITKTASDEAFDGVGGGPDAAEKLASDAAAIPSEHDNLRDSEVLICFLSSS